MSIRNHFDTKGLERAVARKMKNLPLLMANVSERHFKESFRKKGFTDNGLENWKPTKRPNQRGSLMVRSGNLKRSIRVSQVSRNSFTIVAGGSHVKYAKIHNEGGTTQITVTPRMRRWAWAKFKETKQPIFRGIATTKKDTITINIPKRQFMGRSQALNRNIRDLIRSEVNIAISIT